jgi:hypothetical protein
MLRFVLPIAVGPTIEINVLCEVVGLIIYLFAGKDTCY